MQVADVLQSCMQSAPSDVSVQDMSKTSLLPVLMGTAAVCWTHKCNVFWMEECQLTAYFNSIHARESKVEPQIILRMPAQRTEIIILCQQASKTTRFPMTSILYCNTSTLREVKITCFDVANCTCEPKNSKKDPAKQHQRGMADSMDEGTTSRCAYNVTL